MTKVDYDQLEREYISTNVGFRTLAEKYGMKSFSAIADQARKRNWRQKRIDYRKQVSDRMIQKDAKRFVQEADDMKFEMIQAARAVIYATLKGIQEGTVIPQPRDMLMAIEKLQLLTGEATERTEAQVIGIAQPAAPILSDELLRRLEELTRENGDVTISGPRIRLEGTRQH